MAKGRLLTPGEIILAKRLYGSSINYSKVRVHNRSYIFFQPRNSGMTPNGQIYMSKGAYAPDYSLLSSVSKSFFLHEMAHVWQYQLEVLNPIMAAIGELFSHGFNYDHAYSYTLDRKKDLTDYDIEQQASILEDYYRIFIAGLQPTAGNMQNSLADAKKNRLFQSVLRKFRCNPSYPKQKKACLKRRHSKRRARRFGMVHSK